MKKIVAAFDSLKYSKSTEQYAVELANTNDRLLMGLFLDDFTYHSYQLFDMVGSQGISSVKVKELMDGDIQSRKESVLRFSEATEIAGINSLIRHDKSIAIQELLKETIYCDLLVIAATETLSHYEEDPPTRFIRDLLIDIQCPVLIVPKTYKRTEKIILLYDGDPSSVYAAKMFSYMLPELKNLPIEVVSVKTNEDQKSFPEDKLIKEFIRCHYPGAAYHLLEGIPETEILGYLKGRENVLVVLGAYRRNMISRWFKPSMADALMKQSELPLFIAHF
jgi:nucleotide-binding universal stress UspA family protein